MKGLAPLFLGIFGTFAFSWIGLTVVPTWQIGHLNPESDEEGTDTYPLPQSGMFQRGAHVYAANGCVYCHTQQVRADYIADDIERKWGNRRSAPRDYIFERPVLLGKMRMGQDLANMGARAPAPEESPAQAGAAGPAAQGAAASPAAATAASPSSGARHFACRRVSGKCVAAARATDWCCVAVTRPNGKRHSGWCPSSCSKCADSRCALADPDSRSAADVFRRVAPCASLCAAQH